MGQVLGPGACLPCPSSLLVTIPPVPVSHPLPHHQTGCCHLIVQPYLSALPPMKMKAVAEETSNER